ncbi:HAMP domain-containing sensor histidine kinase [Simiduia curdlanivorans]|uniref:histidine kinase n=1 Tax=Simiduia curdlanivorans TaxID=1492769 RepID=A0ABV8V8W2_9GAMM|nr:HAMP domain-containing sensor histidine kinase [Simiduia curdlanivorans]MDN3639315.1 HAMP domain-containing sensor histidine kinase [Simiduia curdlanivorans]
MLAEFIRWALYAGDDPATLSAVEARQLSLLRKSQWLVVFLVLVFLLMALRQWIEFRVLGLSVAWVLTVLGLFLANYKPARTAALHTSMLGVSIAILTACLTNGGLGSVASAWLLYMPLIAGVMGGMRAAKHWIVFVLLSFSLLWAVELLGFEAPNLTRPEFQYWQDRIQQFMQGVGVVLSVIALIGQVELSETSLLKTIDSLHEEVTARILAEQKAVIAEQKKTAFFTSMSHELRTPLNAINGFTAMVLKNIDRGKTMDARGEDALQRVLVNGQDMLALVNNLLDVAKSSESEPLLHKESFDLNAQINALMGDLASLASADVRLLNLSDKALVIQTDKSLLRRILVNLIGNALKFTSQGSVQVSCVTQGVWLQVKVVDTGAGISDEERDIIFEPYIRGLAQRGVSGTGLGLMLSQQWAKMLGGKIDFESSLGKGSTFSLYLPRDVIEI